MADQRSGNLPVDLRVRRDSEVAASGCRYVGFGACGCDGGHAVIRDDLVTFEGAPQTEESRDQLTIP